MDTALRVLPGHEPCVETGPVQFGDDWPGLFLRGDNCHAYADALQALLDYGTAPDWILIPLRGLLEDLKSPLVKLQ